MPFLFKRTCCCRRYEAYFCATTPYLTVCPKKLAARIPKARSVLMKTSSGRPLKTNTPAAPVPKVGEVMMIGLVVGGVLGDSITRNAFSNCDDQGWGRYAHSDQASFPWTSTQQSEFSILPKLPVWLLGIRRQFISIIGKLAANFLAFYFTV